MNEHEHSDRPLSAPAQSLGQYSFYDPAVNPSSRPRRPPNARDDAWTRAFLHEGMVVYIDTHWNERPFIHHSSYWYDESRHELVFRSNVVGRLRANSDRHDHLCLEVSEFGRFLPSNNPLETFLQYRSVVVFGKPRVLEGQEAHQVPHGVIQKYSPTMMAGQEYRLIRNQDLTRTSVYAVAVNHRSGKETWAERAHQTDEQPPLGGKWFAFTSFRTTPAPPSALLPSSPP